MPRIISARAYANNEVIYIAWAMDGPIEGCRGFDVRRIDGTSEDSLPAWVPFEGQSNEGWQPKTTAIWPVQRLSWKDLTWRDELDKRLAAKSTGTTSPPIDRVLKYRVVPLIGSAASLQPQPDLGAVTNPVHLALSFGDISVAFNNGILSTQWLTNELKQDYGTDKPLTALKKAIATTGDKIRVKLAGDALPFLRRLLERAESEKGAVALALYELTDPELIDLLLRNKNRIRIILSNTSATDKAKKEWDTENEPVRQKLHGADVQIQDRMFNNDHIGHNKFAVLLDRHGQPTTVLAGSTNWTQNGLCAQSNNALLIESTELANAYYAYFKRLLADRLPAPDPLTAPTRNVQGPGLRRANMQPTNVLLDGGKTKVQAWFSPNTVAATKTATSPAPPDLAQLFALMRAAKQAIFFLVFLPSLHGDHSIIETAIEMGKEDPSLLVLGAVSNSMAMPIAAAGGPPPEPVPHARTFLVNSKRKAGRSRAGGGALSSAHVQTPPVFKDNATEVVLASALHAGDLVGAFQQELLKAGNAIIHDKIVVIDPLSDNPVVACSSHNLGYKASYGNDENLLIIQGNQALAEAYAVHVLDIYDHYRFRAEQDASGGKAFDGFLQDNDGWQEDYIAGKRGTDAAYFAPK
jgi:phosphatidylserine/phosphatidylglycerophosphate/cardiolipin synthase-like enzyme